MAANTNGWVVAVAVALSLGGCGGAQKRGAEAYEHADYRGAMVQWRYLEGGEAKMSDKARVRYLVYRGLTHYRIYQRSNDPGEAAAALHFLARAQLGYDAGKPRWLDAETVSDMKVALGDLARRAAGGPAARAPFAVVVVRAPTPSIVVETPLPSAPAPKGEPESPSDAEPAEAAEPAEPVEAPEAD